VSESFFGRPLGRPGEAVGAAWFAVLAAAGIFLAWPFERDGEPFEADLEAAVVLCTAAWFLLAQHSSNNSIIALRLFIGLNPYAAISLASCASVKSSYFGRFGPSGCAGGGAFGELLD